MQTQTKRTKNGTRLTLKGIKLIFVCYVGVSNNYRFRDNEITKIHLSSDVIDQQQKENNFYRHALDFGLEEHKAEVAD